MIFLPHLKGWPSGAFTNSFGPLTKAKARKIAQTKFLPYELAQKKSHKVWYKTASLSDHMDTSKFPYKFLSKCPSIFPSLPLQFSLQVPFEVPFQIPSKFTQSSPPSSPKVPFQVCFQVPLQVILQVPHPISPSCSPKGLHKLIIGPYIILAKYWSQS